MKKLTLVIGGNTNFNPSVLINGCNLKYKEDKRGNKSYEIESEKDEIDIEIFKWFDIESKHWLLTSIIFYIISFFGLFDIRDNKKPYSLKYKGKIKLNEEENNLKVMLNSFKPDELAFVFEGNCALEANETNKYFIDENVVSRRKKLKKVKKIIRLVVLALVIIIGVLFLI